MTVIRKAIVEIELRSKGGRLDAPEVRAFQETAKATREVEKATRETTRATKEHTLATQEFGFKSATAFREGGEGAFRMARGIALLSSSGSDDLQKLIQKVAGVQGAFDVFSGSAKLASSLAPVFGGPWGIAIAGVTALLTAGTLAWAHHSQEIEKANEAQRENTRLLEESRARGRERERVGGVGARDLEREILSRRTGVAQRPNEAERRALAEQRALEARLADLADDDLQLGDDGLLGRFRPGRGTPAHRRRRAAQRREDLATAAQDDPELRSRLIDVEREKLNIAERLKRLSEEQLQRDQLRMNQREVASERTLRENLAGRPDVASQVEGLHRDFARREEERLRRHEDTAEKILQIWESAARRMRQIDAGNEAR